jgi:hypothetical protein
VAVLRFGAAGQGVLVDAFDDLASVAALHLQPAVAEGQETGPGFAEPALQPGGTPVGVALLDLAGGEEELGRRSGQALVTTTR